MFRFLCLLSVFIIFAAPTIYADPSVAVELHDSNTHINVVSKLETLKVDESESPLTFQQVSTAPYSQRFTLNTEGATNFGVHHGDLWLRFELRSHSAETWYFFIDNVLSGASELFIQPLDEPLSQAESGESSTLFSRLDYHRTPAWKLNLPRNRSFMVYWHIHSSQGILLAPVKLMQDEVFFAYSSKQYIFWAMILSGILVLALYNFVLSFTLQDKAYLIFVCFLCVFSLLSYRMMNFSPSLFDWLIDGNNWYFDSLSFLAQSTIIFYWYTLHKGIDPFIEKYLQALALLSLLVALAIIFFPVSSSVFPLSNGILLLVTPVLMWWAVLRTNNRNVRNNFIISIVFMISLGISVPIYSGLFLNYPPESLYISAVGYLLAFLLFSLNHADRSRQLREQAERAEANNKATQNFLMTMSHELRTPMHTVLGVNELLKSTELGQQQKSYLKMLEVASRQMLGLIDNILDLVRLSNSSQALISKKPFNLKAMLSDVDNLLRIQAEQKQLSFDLDVRNIPNSLFNGDRQRLTQVLVNLLGNAVKYTYTGRVMLNVDTDMPTKAGNVCSQYLHFSVEDTGCGISAEKQKLLFQPFYQVDSSTARQNGGSGLGLAIAYQLVEQMGGKLELESIPGVGSRFFFSLCLTIQPEIAEPDKNAEASINPKCFLSSEEQGMESNISVQASEPMPELSDQPLSGVSILLVDDGELNCIIGEKLLTLHGADANSAASGAEALGLLKKQSFDLVLMDVSMPEMDGYETTGLIRNELLLTTLPIIALTAHAVPGEKGRCLAAGMNDYISKPFKIDQLLHLITLHVGKLDLAM